MSVATIVWIVVGLAAARALFLFGKASCKAKLLDEVQSERLKLHVEREALRVEQQGLEEQKAILSMVGQSVQAIRQLPGIDGRLR